MPFGTQKTAFFVINNQIIYFKKKTSECSEQALEHRKNSTSVVSQMFRSEVRDCVKIKIQIIVNNIKICLNKVVKY